MPTQKTKILMIASNIVYLSSISLKFSPDIEFFFQDLDNSVLEQINAARNYTGNPIVDNVIIPGMVGFFEGYNSK